MRIPELTSMSDPTILPRNDAAKDPAPVVNGSLWMMTAVAMLFLAVRLWIKVSRRCGLWWDDGVLALSWATLVVNNALISALVSLGFGTGRPYTTHMTIMLAVSAIMTPLARIWSKTSFALTLLRVLDDKDRFQRLFIWFIIASMHILSILYIVMAWRSICETADHENGEAVGRIKGPCVPLATVLAIQISNVALSAFMDFALALFPWLIIWKLQMRMQEKIGTAVAMSLGILSYYYFRAGVFAILQIKAMITLAGPGYSECKSVIDLLRLSSRSLPPSFFSFYLLFARHLVTGKLAQLSIVASAEPTITIVAASIPVLRILLRDLYHKPTLVEVRAHGVSSKADLRRTSTKIDSVPDLPRGIMHKTEVDIEYSRQSSYSVRNMRGPGYELEEWKIG
ncbi:hypothetical protein PG996_014144 [Apiospora saccharicola]|uniref:Rhodopsin domain-containing protein n=1 Tax=Apiospora saccharicola TaxID=335842 RepID=A0ABR1THI2_9PEZI